MGAAMLRSTAGLNSVRFPLVLNQHHGEVVFLLLLPSLLLLMELCESLARSELAVLIKLLDDLLHSEHLLMTISGFDDSIGEGE